jgi:hypothetical protein
MTPFSMPVSGQKTMAEWGRSTAPSTRWSLFTRTAREHIAITCSLANSVDTARMYGGLGVGHARRLKELEQEKREAEAAGLGVEPGDVLPFAHPDFDLP